MGKGSGGSGMTDTSYIEESKNHDAQQKMDNAREEAGLDRLHGGRDADDDSEDSGDDDSEDSGGSCDAQSAMDSWRDDNPDMSSKH